MQSWKFDKGICEVFDKHVVQSVPQYNEIQKLICNLSHFFIGNEDVIYDIGCSTGETLSNLYLTHKDKNLKLIGIDNSKDMIEKAKEKDILKRIIYLNKRIESFKFEEKSSFITSILSLQFVKPSERQKILKKIYNSLNFQGAFIIVEKIYSNNSQFQDIFNQLYYDFKLDNDLNEEHIFNKAIQLRGVLQPCCNETNIKLLENAGFTNIDVFFKYLNFIGYIAIKE